MDEKTLKRLMSEYFQLKKRIAALQAFIWDDKKFKKVDELEQDWLLKQFEAMRMYEACLFRRIQKHKGGAVK